MASVSSEKLTTRHWASTQRQVRLRHTNTTGRSPAGRSRTRTVRRPLPTARTPHPGHPATSAVVSTEIHTSPSASIWAHTTKPSIPSSAVALELPSTITGGLPSVAVSTAATMARPSARTTDPYRTSPPLTPTQRSSRRARFPCPSWRLPLS